MLTRDNILYPEEFFPHTTYSHNDGRFGLLGEEPRDIVDWEMFYRAGEYIKRFRSKIEKGKDKKIFGDISNYSFAVFQSNDSRSYTTRIGGYISFPSEEVNSILGIPPETTVKEAMEKQGRREISIDNPIGYLGTNIFPDTDYMLTINYQNTPIGFLGFDIDRDGSITIKQLQGSNIVDEGRLFFVGKHHMLDGFDWKKVLITFFEDYLRNKGYTGKLIIQCSEHNKYYTHDLESSNDHPENIEKLQKRNQRLKSHYNNIPLELGYSRNVITRKTDDPGYCDFSKDI